MTNLNHLLNSIERAKDEEMIIFENYGVDALAEKLYNEYSAVLQTAKQ